MGTAWDSIMPQIYSKVCATGGGAPTDAHARPFRSVVCGVTKRLRPRAPRPPDRSASAQDKRPGANRVTTPTTRRYGEEPAARRGCEKLRAALETACDF